jgi:hypothetical protein
MILYRLAWTLLGILQRKLFDDALILSLLIHSKLGRKILIGRNASRLRQAGLLLVQSVAATLILMFNAFL